MQVFLDSMLQVARGAPFRIKLNRRCSAQGERNVGKKMEVTHIGLFGWTRSGSR